MQSKKEISEELGQLSMVVAGIDRQMPYGVPEGYFVGFPAAMLHILAEDTADEALTPEWGKGPAFSVPTGYFEGFASRMMDRIKAEGQGEPIQDAGEEMAGLSPLLSRIDKKMPYSVPEGYFEELEAIVDEKELSPLMAGLQGQSPYQAPEGYFDSFPERMTAHVGTAKAAPARVISMNRSRKAWWQYSAAAVVAGFIFSIGWLRLHTPANKSVISSIDVTQSLAKVTDQELGNYMDNQDIHTAQLQQDEDLGNSTASLEISDNDVRSFLGDISDNELNLYMEEHGDLKDYPTN
jgi:hypothetical protein